MGQGTQNVVALLLVSLIGGCADEAATPLPSAATPATAQAGASVRDVCDRS
ncbi:MAG TPA: hypothetical protein VJV78_08010 [Polyangiales bacterium]|nr:hypothetical protein [Polyangiales bacterium]